MKATDVDGAQYADVSAQPGETVAQFKRCWAAAEQLDVRLSLVSMHLVKAGPGKPTDAEEQAALSGQRLLSDPSATLRAAGVTDGCWLLAVFASGTGVGRAVVAPSGGSLRARFMALLREANVTRPDATVLQLLERHMPAALLAVFDADAALELYERGTLLPGTPTRIAVRETTGVSLSGPLLGQGGEPLSNVLTGTSRAGRPLVAKLLFEPASRAVEVQLCAALKLAPWDDPSSHPHFMARASAVDVPVDSADRHGVASARRHGASTALLMPRHPACLAELPQLSGKAIARGARQLECALTFLHAAHGADEAPWVHMVVRPANVLVSARLAAVRFRLGGAPRRGGAHVHARLPAAAAGAAGRSVPGRRAHRARFRHAARLAEHRGAQVRLEGGAV